MIANIFESPVRTYQALQKFLVFLLFVPLKADLPNKKLLVHKRTAILSLESEMESP